MKKIFLGCFMVLISFQSVFAQTAIVAITENQVVTINLERENDVIVLKEGTGYTNPRISTQHNRVAYQDNQSNVYVSSLEKPYPNLIKIDGVKDYTWYENQLIFSKNEGGVYRFDFEKNKADTIIENSGYLYDELAMNKQEILFSKKYLIHDQSNWPIGISSFDTKGLEEWLLVSYEPVTKASLGFNPAIAKISSDGNLIYIWCKPNSGSISADGVHLGIYDTQVDQLIKFDQLMMLAYPDNLAVSPTDSHTIAIINGEGRYMGERKSLELFNVKSQMRIALTSKEIVAMTPTFSQDGQKLYYAKGLATVNEYKPFELGRSHIYMYNLNSNQTIQLTDRKDTFDFYPQEIQNNELVFLRFVGKDKLNLMRRLADGKEITLLENINTDFQYYGHLDVNKILDVKY